MYRGKDSRCGSLFHWGLEVKEVKDVVLSGKRTLYPFAVPVAKGFARKVPKNGPHPSLKSSLSVLCVSLCSLR